MREFRPMPTTPRAMRHFEQATKRQIGRLLKPSHFLKLSHPCDRRARPVEKDMSRVLLKLSHSVNMREFRPMPTTPRAMRHFEQATKREIGRLLKPSHFLKLSHPSDRRARPVEKDLSRVLLKLSYSANMGEFRPMPTTPRVMRHFEQAAKREIGRLLKPSHFLKLSHPSDRRARSGENWSRRAIPTPVRRCGGCERWRGGG